MLEKEVAEMRKWIAYHPNPRLTNTLPAQVESNSNAKMNHIVVVVTESGKSVDERQEETSRVVPSPLSDMT